MLPGERWLKKSSAWLSLIALDNGRYTFKALTLAQVVTLGFTIIVNQVVIFIQVVAHGATRTQGVKMAHEHNWYEIGSTTNWQVCGDSSCDFVRFRSHGKWVYYLPVEDYNDPRMTREKSEKS